MKRAVLFLVISVFFSCKNEDKKKVQETMINEQVIEKDNIIKISINARFLEDDRFDLFYVADFPENNFNEKERLSKYLKGNDHFQSINFELPNGVFPYKFRIDLGNNENKHLTPIEIKTIMLEFNGNQILIENSELDHFFYANEFLERTDNGYLRKEVNGRYDPFILSKPLLDKKMEIEL